MCGRSSGSSSKSALSRALKKAKSYEGISVVRAPDSGDPTEASQEAPTPKRKTSTRRNRKAVPGSALSLT